MAETVFLRLLPYEDKAAALAEAVTAVRDGITGGPTVYVADPFSFSRIPGSPFAYWVSDELRRKFVELPPFEGDGRTVKQGLATADDFRFVRAWWEVEPEKIVAGTAATTPAEFRQQTFQSKRWVLFAKGGEYSPYYADVHLVVNWKRDGEEIKQHICDQYTYLNGKWEWVAKNTDYYFRPGLTWPRRTTSGISVRTLPYMCIFADKGPSLFVQRDDKAMLYYIIGLMNSRPFEGLLEAMLGAAAAAARSYEVGLVQKMPLPEASHKDLSTLTERACLLRRSFDYGDETTHCFRAPTLASERRAPSLAKAARAVEKEQTQIMVRLAEIRQSIDTLAYELYGFSERDRWAVEQMLVRNSVQEDTTPEGSEEMERTKLQVSAVDELVADLLSYAVGCVFGRWDVRMALDPSLLPRLQAPFDPLPACSPGMLVGPDGLPARPGRIASEEWLRARLDAITLPPADAVGRDTIADAEYPLRLDWDGILVDDEGHPDDIVGRVREVLALFWPDRTEAIEQEACRILGVTSLRDYFRKPGKGGCFDYHVKRYSKSRRKAPIYWLFQSSRKNYALWLYYHRLDRDTLFKALEVYVRPKIRREENYLAELRQRRSQADTAGLEAKRLEKAIAEQESLLSELDDLRAKLERAASLYLKPDLNDGVILNMAPLWELVPWKEPRKYWEELLQGRYEWSSISRQLRQKKV